MINLIYTILPIITLIIGFCFGFYLNMEREIPKLQVRTPTKIIKEYKREKKKEQEETEMEQYMENIDNYPNNQKSFK